MYYMITRPNNPDNPRLDTKKIEKAHSLLKNHNEENRIIPHLTVRQVTLITLITLVSNRIVSLYPAGNPDNPDSSDSPFNPDNPEYLYSFL